MIVTSTVFANRTFLRLFTAQVVALVGTGLLTVALGLLAYDLAGSKAGAVLGTALTIKMAAYVLVAPVVSAVAYRIPRRALLIGSDVVRGTIAALLPFVDQVWQIYVLIFLLQAASATFTPTFQSVIPAVLVREDEYTRGLSLSRLAYDLESLLSPMLAAALLTVMTYNNLFLGTVVGFAVSAILVVATVLPAIPVEKQSDSFWLRTTGGAREMLRRPVLRALLALNLSVAAATAVVVVNTVVYVNDVLAASSSAVALLLAFYGGGSMIVALTMPRLVRAVSDRTVMLAGAVIIPVALTATAVLLALRVDTAYAWPAFIAAWTALGVGTSLINTPSARLVRYESSEGSRSSLFTAQFSLSHACFFVTYPLAGWVGALVGQAVAAAALGTVAAIALPLAARFWPTASSSVGRELAGAAA